MKSAELFANVADLYFAIIWITTPHDYDEKRLDAHSYNNNSLKLSTISWYFGISSVSIRIDTENLQENRRIIMWQYC